MNQEEIATQYDQIGEDYLKLQRRLFERSPDLTRKFIHSNIPTNLEGKKLIDIGCGSGIDLEYYQKIGAEVWGTDSSEFMLGEASKIINKDRLKLTTHSNISLEPSYFDIVTTRFSLHYTEDIDAVYKNICNGLKPGALLVAVVRHPLTDFIRKEKKDYTKIEPVTLGFNKSSLIMKSYSHTIVDYFSPFFLRNFDLQVIEEGHDQEDMNLPEGITIPNYLGFKAVKR